MIKLVKKDSGHFQKFSLLKLKNSIAAALKHAGVHSDTLLEHLVHEVLEHLECQAKEIIDTETIRQAVLHIMNKDHERRAADAYELVSLHFGKDIKIHEVIKRGGGKEPFHPHKIFKSLKKSFTDAGLDGIKISEELTHEIINHLEKEYVGKAIPVQEIRNLAARLLAERGFAKVEKSYLLHKYL